MGVTVAPARTREFREALAAGALTADGAMGTMLAAMLAPRGGFTLRSLDELNLSLPALVRDVHQEYLRAGAQILGTNTFGANRERLGLFGFAEKTSAINQAGARIAREAARGFSPDSPAFVAGVVGPLGARLEPLGRIRRDEARALFQEQIHALVEAGVDLLMLETFQDLHELEEAVLAARQAAAPEMAVIAHVSVEENGTLACGASVREFTQALDEWPVDAIGLNCSSGPGLILETAAQMAQWTAKPLSILPSAGLPLAEAHHVYPVSAEYLAGFVGDFLRLGARIVGGCCGTTPDHIRRIRAAVKDTPADTDLRQPVPVSVEEVVVDEPHEAIPAGARSGLGARLAARKFVDIVELLPPRGADPSPLVVAAGDYKYAGFDFVAIPARSNAQASVAGAAACYLLQHTAEVECILQCGQCEVSGLESQLLSAHALGVRNVLCSADAVGSAALAANLNRGLDLGGHALGSRTFLLVGVTVNPCAPDLDAELRRFESNLKAGADYAVIQPSFDLDFLEELLKFLEPYRLPVIAGLRPLSSVRDAEFLINEWRTPVPGVYVERLRAAENSEAEGLAIACEMAQGLRGMVAGIYWRGRKGMLPPPAELAHAAGLQSRA